MRDARRASLSCPRCGTRPTDLAGSVGVDGSETRLRVPVSCPGCDAPLALVVSRTVSADASADDTGSGGRGTDSPDARSTANTDHPSRAGGSSAADASAADGTAGEVGVEMWLEDRREDESGHPTDENGGPADE